jgi:hypothetical protein
MPIYNANTIGWFNPPEDGKPVRHVHPPNSKNWHDAHESHGVNPGSPSDPHVIYNVYDNGIIRWGEKNRYITNKIKDQLVKDAKLAYENGTIGPRYDLPEAPQSAPDGTSTNGADPDVIARLEAIEDVMLGTAQSVNDHDKAIASLQSSNGSSNGTNPEYDRKIGELAVENASIKAQLEDIKANKPQRIEIFDHSTQETRTLELVKHKDFDDLWTVVRRLKQKRRNVWIAGPAGCGKSFIVEQIAQLLGLEMQAYGSVLDKIEMVGYKDINGMFVDTTFFRIYTQGGVLLLDECDASVPEAMVALNMALANAKMAFPEGTFDRHPNCYIFATANTMGAGADAQYSTRFKQDDAFMSRFAIFPMDYDEKLEIAMLPDHAHEFARDVVQVVRRASREASGHDAGEGFVITPRHCELASDMLEPRDDVPMLSRNRILDIVFGNIRKHEKWPHIGRAAEDWAKRDPANNKSNLRSVNFR